MEKNLIHQEIPGVPDAPPFASAPTPESYAMTRSVPIQPQPGYVFTPNIPPLGPQPCLVTCPSCNQQHMSKILSETATKTHLLAALLCVLGCICCFWIPYCVDTCKNINHYCANCNAYLGTYNK